MTDAGIVTPVRLLQSLKTAASIEVMEEGISSVPVRPEQSENALVPMDLTDFGIVSVPVRPEQP